MGRPLDEDIIIKILERWQKAFKENSHYVSASDLSLVIKDVRELPTIQSVATDTNVGDTISRQAAIDAINSWRGRFSEEYNEAIDNCENSIIELPPVQPEPKVEFHDKDHVWIDGKQYISLRRFQEAVKEAQPKEGYWKKDEKDDCPPVFRRFRICSVCGAIETSETSYCPNCGAKMTISTK